MLRNWHYPIQILEFISNFYTLNHLCPDIFSLTCLFSVITMFGNDCTTIISLIIFMHIRHCSIFCTICGFHHRKIR